jgi:DNA-binding SARP family transcriptional activator
MRFGVLGPLLAEIDGASCVPTAHKARQLLAFLILNANQVVPVHACIDELWQSDPPKSSVSTVQTYVLQIRKLLRRASPELGDATLVTLNRNYLLNIRPADLDSHVFFAHVRRGQAALGHGRLQHAAAYFRRALGQWRGPALLDVPEGPAITMHRERLEETRFGVVEQRVEAELRLGLHREILAELQVRAEQYPLRENVQAQYMIALYRCGRRVQAIDVFTRLRGTLFDQFGLDPSPRMSRLHGAILAADPALDLPAGQLLRGVAG